MTSKKELQAELRYATEARDSAWNRIDRLGEDLVKAEAERHIANETVDSVKNQLRFFEEVNEVHNAVLNADRRFKEDILLLEPQLKHYLTDGAWDFDRIHRAAEHLRGEDALASVGYTDQCVYPDNVTPLFPHDPSDGYGAA